MPFGLKRYFDNLPVMEDNKVLDDLAPIPARGPLDDYRKRATFDWRSFRVKYHTEEILALKMRIWRYLEQEPLFAHDVLDGGLARDREVTFKRVKKMVEMNFVPFEEAMMNPLKSMGWVCFVFTPRAPCFI